MEGRFGPYVTDGTTHATLPKSADPKAVTLDEAVALIDAKAAKGPVKKAAPQAPARRVGAKASSWRHAKALSRVEQMKRAALSSPIPTISADREQRGEAADRRGQRAEHAKLGAIVAIVGIERIADEAAVAGPGAEQATWPWNCCAAARQQRQAEPRRRRR